MKKALVIIYSVFSFVSFAAIVFFTGYLVYKSYEKNSTEREREFPAFKNEVVAWFAEAKSFKSELFTEQAKTAVEKDQQLIALLIYSKKDGILYFGEEKPENDKTYLKNLQNGTTGVTASQWSGKPEYVGLPLGALVFTLRFMETAGGELYMDGIYWPVDMNEISQYIKWGFFILFVWLILSIIIRLFVSTKSMREIYEMEPEQNMSPGQAKNVSEPVVMAGEDYNVPPDEGKKIETEEKGAGLHEVKKETSLGLFSPNTGLGWQDHLDERLKFEINRTASFNQDMVFAFISIDDFEKLGDSFAVYKTIAKIILNSFPFQDLAFGHGNDGYALILPDIDIQQGIKTLTIFQRKIAKTDFGNMNPTISIGLSSRNGRLMSEKTLIQEAGKALSKAKQEGRQRIFAFKADADKYRKVIADKF